jgi:RNA polymerase sigma-70 factor (ECF subfamily)
MTSIERGLPAAMVPDRSHGARVDWGEAVRLHDARVIASLLAMSLPLSQAEDLASQAWARLIELDQAGRLPEVKLPGLAIKQARFLALDWIQARKRETDLSDDLAAPAASAEHALIARSQVAVALRVLSAASPSAQAVFRHIYDDPPLPHAEIAGRVGLSTQRVRQILCEVRKKIREALETNA